MSHGAEFGAGLSVATGFIVPDENIVDQRRSQSEKVRRRRSGRQSSTGGPAASHDALNRRSSNRSNTQRSINSSSLARSREALELVFKDLSYSVPVTKASEPHQKGAQKQLLTSLSGVFRPGRLTAIMGSSGAGKTTLLSVLAGNIRKGVVEGTIMVNGEQYSTRMLKEICGFVFQDDILLPHMKVREAIAMSALLRLPKSVDAMERRSRVDDIIELLGLEQAQDTIVGSAMRKGISGGERKRTAIAMEMVINPAMLFLDEPTTGLDTFTAYSVILSLSNLAKQNRTVVATIHQPSTEIFNLFDDLLILSRGRIAYLGPTKDVVDYFGRNGFPCSTYVNPSDHLFMNVLREFGSIDVEEEPEEDALHSGVAPRNASPTGEQSSGAAAPPGASSAGGGTRRDPPRQAAMPEMAVQIGDGSTSHLLPHDHSSSATPIEEGPNRSSETRRQEQCNERIETLLRAWEESAENNIVKIKVANPIMVGVLNSVLRRMAPFSVQFRFLLVRAFKSLIRNHMLIATRLFQAIFLGLIIGLTYLDTNQYSVRVQIQDKSGALFFIATNTFFAAATQVLGIFSEEKQVFYREFNGGYYCLSAYYISKTLVEIPGQIIGPFVLVLIAYYMIGLNPPFSDCLLIATLAAASSLCGNMYGVVVASFIDDLTICLTVTPLIVLPLILVSGIFVAELPVFLNWIKYISPIYYAFSGFLRTEFTRPFPNCDDTVERCDGGYVYEVLNYTATFPAGVDLAFLAAIYAILWVVGFLALYYGARRKG